MKVVLIVANSAGPDVLQHNAAIHLGLHCLPIYSFRGFNKQRVTFLKNQEVYQNKLSSAAVVIVVSSCDCSLLKILANSLDPDQDCGPAVAQW